MKSTERPAVMPVRAENIPHELKALNRWVCWKWTLKREGGRTKWDKPPRKPNGSPAAVNNFEHWSTFRDCYRAVQAGKVDGVGIVLPPGITGLDLDDVRTADGALNVTGEMLAAKFRTYAEVSPSGTGVKFLMSGAIDPELPARQMERGVELYQGAESGTRYFTITGDVLSDEHRTLTGQREGISFVQHLLAEPFVDFSDHIDDDFDLFTTDENRERALSAVRALKPERSVPRDTWLAVGMSLHAINPGEDLFSAWVKFSELCPEKFPGVDHCRYLWDRFKTESSGRLVGPGTLFHFARRDGWRETKGFRLDCVPVPQFNAEEIHREYAVEDFLTVGEPMIVGGASKSLKTSVSLDLAVSLASGTPFLGVFPVPIRRRVVVISGESGEVTTQQTIRDICQSKGLHPEDLADMFIGFRLPKLDDLSHVGALISGLRERDIRFAIIDPLYRSLRVGDGASNVYSMGEKLELIAERIHRAGITPILNHHFRKQGKTYSDAPELEDLSQAGIAEFGRQFCLLKRREAYQYDGVHRLWFTWGGSAGHQGTRVLQVVTGTRKTGTRWDVRLIDEKEFRESQSEDDSESLKLYIFSFLKDHPGASKTEICNAVKGRRTAVVNLLELLSESGEVVVENGNSGGRPRVKYTLGNVET